MKEYDRVELIKDRQEAIGVERGDKETVLDEKRLGYRLVYFDGEIFQNIDGVRKTAEIDVGVKEEQPNGFSRFSVAYSAKFADQNPVRFIPV